jgi:SET domain-containing protein
MTIQEQILFLNETVLLKLAPSKIHGIGVFALRDIPSGKRLNATAFPRPYTLTYANFGKLHKEVNEEILQRWPSIVEGDNFMYPDTNFQAYMNHSDDPNYSNVLDIALKDIKAGEEIFEDYKNIKGHKVVHAWIYKEKK